jgi:hypothetical protein
VGSYGHIPSRQALNAAVSRDPSAGTAYPLPRAPHAGVLGSQARLEQAGGEILPAHVYHMEEK